MTESAATPGGDPRPDGIRVVLIDDHTVMRQGTRLILHQTDDIRVVAESDEAKEGIELIREHLPDVVVLDIRLRETSGVDVAKEIRKIAPDTRILVLTAYDYDQYVKAMINVGVDGYLLKDASAAELVNAVRVIVAGGTILNPEVASKVVDMFAANRKSSTPTLTEREQDVLQLLSEGMKNSEMAEKLEVKLRTVETHVANLMTKFGAQTRTEVVTQAARHGMVLVEE